MSYIVSYPILLNACMYTTAWIDNHMYLKSTRGQQIKLTVFHLKWIFVENSLLELTALVGRCCRLIEKGVRENEGVVVDREGQGIREVGGDGVVCGGNMRWDGEGEDGDGDHRILGCGRGNGVRMGTGREGRSRRRTGENGDVG